MKKQKWSLSRAFHPKRFKKGVYAVSFHKPGKPLVDRNTRLYQVTAPSRRKAIQKARKKL